VNLRVAEKEDVSLVASWLNEPEFLGRYDPIVQMSKSEMEKNLEGPNEQEYFIVEKKDGSRIGFISHFYVLHIAGKLMEIGYALVPSERGKGYGTEAVQLLVDYLFLSRDLQRVQAATDVRNLASQRVLEKAGFKREGTMRKRFFMRGEWADDFEYSVLRVEWKEPKVLTKET